MFDTFSRFRAWRVTLCALALAAASFAAACDDDNDNPSTPSDAGSLQIMLTDAPMDAVERVNVFVNSVTVKRVNRDPQVITVNLAPNPVDLLTLRNRVVTLAAGAVEAGQYEWVEVRLDESRSNVVDSGVTRSVDIVNETIRINRTFTIVEDVQTVLTLDFDAAASLTQTQSGGWVLSPVIVVTGNSGTD